MMNAGQNSRRLISVQDLSVQFKGRGATVQALDDVSLDIMPGERIGIVGESGSGKSTLALALGGHIRGNGSRTAGRVLSAGVDVFSASPIELQTLRRSRLGYVFQNPIGTLDPTRRVSRQFFDAEGELVPLNRLTELLKLVGLRDVSRVLASYPHELSGGMAQRVAIAMAIEHEPSIIIADEPTSALDASIRLQILDLLRSLSERTRAALIIVSHDLKAVRTYCQRVCVMYAGRVVEIGASADVFRAPLHPYSAALMRAVPGEEGLGGTILAIPGNPPLLTQRAEACAFADRCSHVFDSCREYRPQTVVTQARGVTCHLVEGGVAWEPRA
jgi:oligopeptide/dipeptide ABC transporter ATP-binding protein